MKTIEEVKQELQDGTLIPNFESDTISGIIHLENARDVNDLVQTYEDIGNLPEQSKRILTVIGFIILTNKMSQRERKLIGAIVHVLIDETVVNTATLHKYLYK